MDLETINTMTTTGQNFLQYVLSLFGCAASADKINKFFEKNLLELNPTLKFYSNMYKFFKVGLSEEDKQKLIEKLSEDEKEQKFLAIIRDIDTDKTLAYILNATKALLNDEITLSIYFRICHVVMNTLEEDLQFLKAHIDEKKVKYSIEVGGLMTAGIVYDSGLSESSGVRYSFNELAEMINVYALIGNGENAIKQFDIDKPPQTIFLTSDNVATNEEISKMFDNVFGNK